MLFNIRLNNVCIRENMLRISVLKLAVAKDKLIVNAIREKRLKIQKKQQENKLNFTHKP